MTQGLFTSITGIKANQVRLDAVSDNIANLNTVAFKGTTVNFESVFSRTLTNGNAPTGQLGGTNPKQIGLGVDVGEIGRNFSQGNIQTTGRSSDLNIQGEGFFVLENPGTVFGASSNYVFTRAGNFSLDANGFLVNSGGLKVVGTNAVSGNGFPTSSYVQLPMELNVAKTVDANGNVTGVTIDNTGGAGTDTSISTYSIGKDGAITVAYSNGDRLTVKTDAAGTGRELVFMPSEGGELTASAGITVNNGLTPNQLQLQCAKVVNNGGLVSVGGNLFSNGPNSGDVTFGIGTEAGLGTIGSGGLETSNVDLTKEFSDLMLSQRGLEANSRSFEAHNKILQTITNLAR